MRNPRKVANAIWGEKSWISIQRINGVVYIENIVTKETIIYRENT